MVWCEFVDLLKVCLAFSVVPLFRSSKHRRRQKKEKKKRGMENMYKSNKLIHTVFLVYYINNTVGPRKTVDFGSPICRLFRLRPTPLFLSL